MKKVMYCLLAVALLAALLIGCAPKEEAPAPSPAKPTPIVLKLLQVFPIGHANTRWVVPTFMERVNERAKGELVIERLGGPEVMPGFDQFEAQMKGVFDVAMNVVPYYYRAIPEAQIFWLRKHIASMEDRESGLFDYMQKLYNDIGIQYLGLVQGRPPGGQGVFFLFPNEPVTRPQELAGRVIRTAPIYDSFFRKMGISPVVIPYAETYTSLERGTVDGFAWPTLGPLDAGWFEVTKYVIDHGFYAPTQQFFVNLDSFQRLPKHLQDLMMDVVEEMEPEVMGVWEQQCREEREKWVTAGVNFIKFTPEDAKWYIDLSWEAGKEEAKQNFRPEHFDKLFELAGY
ncbi:TRAP transporter substrate-binding protein DctP [Chloroflexota bacterium]